MPVRGTQGACPATAVSRRPRRQTAAAILVRGAGSMRTNGCRPRANCRCCRHICAGRPAWGGGNMWQPYFCGARPPVILVNGTEPSPKEPETVPCQHTYVFLQLEE